MARGERPRPAAHRLSSPSFSRRPPEEPRIVIEPLPRPRPLPRTESPLTYEGHPIRAIATDIDGTLTDMRRLLEWDAVLALRSAEALGVPVILATGNIIPSTKTFQHAIGTTGPIVCENGGTLYWELREGAGDPTDVHKKVLHGREEADEVVAELRRRGHKPIPISSDPWRESEAALELASIDEEVVRQVVHDMGKTDLYVVATGFACHILNKGTHKARGLEHALEWLNTLDPRFAPEHPQADPRAEPVRTEEVLALGDSMNDLELFGACRVSGAVANAPERLKDAATIVSDKQHGAGVRDILAQCGLDVEAFFPTPR